MPGSRFLPILKTLARYEVEYIVVGGVAAVLRDAPVSTFDLDVVHSTAADNVVRLKSALEELDGVYPFQPERQLRPEISHLGSPGPQLLMTRWGPLGVLGAIGEGRGYPQLVEHAPEVTLGEGLRVRVLDLATQIAVKEETGGEKDRAVLPLLRRVLEES